MERTESDLETVTGLADPVRARLYQAVARSDSPIGRDAAASAVGIGRPLAAYHLDKLVELGLLTASYQRPAGRFGPGAGRPSKVYARSAREFAVTVPPREYELAARLLAAALESDQVGASRSKLLDAAREFGTDLGVRTRSAAPGLGPRRAVETALRQYGFEPSTAGDGSVELRNCPFHRLVAAHRDLVCGMNLALLQGVISGVNEPGLRPSLDPEPGRCCVVIGPSGQPGGAAAAARS
ncbi:MAG TPA: helix-turn-helix domain-containing protein [Streptosporangiaceae bacterium]|nr:helix-turn-helix domain-containing protein [Streptosporangiaceae bacterium]